LILSTKRGIDDSNKVAGASFTSPSGTVFSGNADDEEVIAIGDSFAIEVYFRFYIYFQNENRMRSKTS
jgi:hypothetical protein